MAGDVWTASTEWPEQEKPMSTPSETPTPAPEGGDPAEPQEPTRPPGPQASAEQTFSQSDLDRIVSDRLKREQDKTAKKYGDYDELKAAAARLAEIEESQKSEQQKLTERLEAETAAKSAAEQQLADLQVQALRQRIAVEKGLTPALASRLRGDTEDDITADAEELLKAFGPPDRGRPHAPVESLRPGSMPSGDGGAPTDMNDWMRQKTPTTN